MKRKFKNQKILYVLLSLLSIAVITLTIKNQLLTEEIKNLAITTTTIVEIQIFEITEKIKNESPELSPYLRYPSKIKLLYRKDLDELSLKQPAIYSGLKEPIYRIEFLNDREEGLLIFYDPKSKEIIRKFEITRVVL